MDFIKKIFVGVLGFLQGLLGGITKTLGIGKSEYFLELMDGDAPDNGAASSPASKGGSASATTNGSSASASQSTNQAARPSKAEVAKAASAKASESPSISTPGSPASKPAPDIVTSTSNAAQSIQSPAQPRTSEPAASTPVVSSAASNNGSTADAPKDVEPFAPNFLLNRSTTGGRRRPGPSLNPFKDMARDMGGAS